MPLPHKTRSRSHAERRQDIPSSNSGNSNYSEPPIPADEETKVILRCKYYGVSRRLIKVLNTFDIKASNDKKTIFRAHKSIMYDIRHRHRTVLLISNLKIDISIPAKIFTIFRLRQGK